MAAKCRTAGRARTSPSTLSQRAAIMSERDRPCLFPGLGGNKGEQIPYRAVRMIARMVDGSGYRRSRCVFAHSHIVERILFQTSVISQPLHHAAASDAAADKTA